MTDSKPLAKRVARAAAYAILGVVLTAALGLLAPNLLNPIQPVVYDAVYLRLGPSGATEFAILWHIALSGAVAIAVATLVGEFVSDRGENARAFAVGLAALGAFLVLSFAAAVAGLEPFLAVALWIVATAVAVPALLWFRYDVRSGGLPAFAGGVPILVFLLLLAGIGVGWGWGYVLTAEEVPSPDAADVVTFEEAPEVRDDLFAPRNCEVNADGDRRCRLQLRGYAHERAAAGFLADHGVRCPYEGSGRDAGSFLTRHEDTYYRITCTGHGD